MMYRRDAKNRSIDEFKDDKSANHAKTIINLNKLINYAHKMVHDKGKKNYIENYCQFVIGDFTFTCHPESTLRESDCPKIPNDYLSRTSPKHIEILYKGKKILSKSDREDEPAGFANSMGIKKLEELIRLPGMQESSAGTAAT